MSTQLFNILESKYGLPSGILDVIWKQESGRGTNMTNPDSGAQGHFQLMEDNWKKAGIDPDNLEQSAEWTAKYAKEAMDARPDLDPVEAIASRHYGGPNESMWGPKTRKYVSDIKAQMGGNTIPGSAIGQGPAYQSGSIQPVGGEMNPLLQNPIMEKLFGMQGFAPPQQAKQLSPMEELFQSPMFLTGANILAESGKTENPMEAIGEGIRGAATTVNANNRFNARGGVRQRLNDPRTANIKDAQFIAYVQQLIKSGQLTPEQGEELLAPMHNEKRPGYSREQEREKAEGKALPANIQESMRGMETAMDVVQSSEQIDNVIKQASELSGAVGWEGIFSFVRNSEPSKLKGLVENLKSRIVLDAMMRLKDASAQGATGFGAMNFQELQTLVNSITSLDVDNQDTWPERLAEIMHDYRKVAERARSGYARNRRYYEQYNSQMDYPETGTYPEAIPSYWEGYEQTRKDIDTGEIGAPGQPRGVTPIVTSPKGSPAPSPSGTFLGFE